MTAQTITKELALTLRHGDILHHKTLKNSDRTKTPIRARVNGAVKTWKTRPEQFSLPMKHGLKDCFNIIETNAAEWELPC